MRIGKEKGCLLTFSSTSVANKLVNLRILRYLKNTLANCFYCPKKLKMFKIVKRERYDRGRNLRPKLRSFRREKNSDVKKNKKKVVVFKTENKM